MPASHPKLLIYRPDRPPEEYLVERSEVVIGRDPASSLALDDSKVSRSHARILDRQGQYTIRDLGSRNGTYVNDRRIGPENGEVSIGDRDRIRVGNHIIQCFLPGMAASDEGRSQGDSDKTRLVTSIEQQLLEPPPDTDPDEDDGSEWPSMGDESPADEIDTGVIERGEMQMVEDPYESVDLDFGSSRIDAVEKETDPAEAESEPLDKEEALEILNRMQSTKVAEDKEPEKGPSGDTSVLPKVSSDTSYDIMADLEELRLARGRILIAGEEGAQLFPLERRRVTIGRGRHNDVVVSHHTISTVHAEVLFGAEGFTLVDKNSTNGTYVENARIRTSRLRDEAFVMFGGIMGLFLHEIDKGKKEEGDRPARVADVLVRRANISRQRAREAILDAEAEGKRLSEVLIMEGDVTPAVWWEASRMADPDRPRGGAGLGTWLLIILAVLVLTGMVYLYLNSSL